MSAAISGAGCGTEEKPDPKTNPDVARAQLIYVGCANPTGDIQIYGLAPGATELTQKSVVQAGKTTSLAALHPNGSFLYVNHRMQDFVSAFAIDRATGGLSWLNEVAIPPGSADGAGPVNVHVDSTGRFLFVPNFRGNDVLVYKLEESGRIGVEVAKHSAGLKAHMVRTDPGNKFAFVPYLGSDIIAQYRFDAATGVLTPNDPPSVPLAPKSGPRHIDFHPNGKWVYLINETAGTVGAFTFDASKGTLAEIESMPAVATDFTGVKNSAHIQVAPSGRHLYISNRGNNTLGVFAINQESGRLNLVAYEDSRGKTPRNFSLDATGKLLIVANQESANIALFTVDSSTGKLGFVRTQPVCELPFFVRAITL